MLKEKYENCSHDSDEFTNEIGSIPELYIELQYPRSNFDDIYSKNIELRKTQFEGIKLSIFYDRKGRFSNPLSVAVIRSYAFYECSLLTSVSIPPSLNTLKKLK